MQYHHHSGREPYHPAGESPKPHLRVDFDRRLKLEFHGSKITSDAGLLAYRELDEALGLTEIAGAALSDLRRGKNTRHPLTGLLRQSVFGRLAGYEDVIDATRLSRDPGMRAIVDRKGLERSAASSSQMGRFETEWLATNENLVALTDLSGVWIDRVHDRRTPRTIMLDMDSSVSPTHGEQEGSVWNGHFGCTCYHPLFVFNQFAILSGAPCVPATSIVPMAGGRFWSRSWFGIWDGSCAGASGPTLPLRRRRSTGSWRPRVSCTRSACPPPRCCKRASRIC